MKRIISIILVSLCLTSLLTSCGGGETVLTCGNHKVTEGEFKYYIATYKSKFASLYTDYENTKAFFETEISEGLTMDDYLMNTVVESVKMTLAANALFDEYGLTLDNEIEEIIDSYIDSLVDDLANGNSNTLNSQLGEYGINMKMLREIYLRDERTALLFDHLYGDNGAVGVTDDDRTEYLEANYVRIRHIYVNNKYKYSTDESGNLIYGDDGYAQTEALTEAETAAKNALVRAIDDSIAEGGDFEEIYEGLSEDKYYENGYYLTRDTDFVDEIVSSAFELEVGEYTKIESDYGVHYIMRLEMDSSPWADESNADFFGDFDSTIASNLFYALIASKIGEVESNDELIEKFSLFETPTNYKY